MKRRISLPVAFIIIGSFVACDEAFSPSAPFQPKMVVYSILSTQSDTQFVRVYSSYNPADNDPSNNQEELPVTDATVTISQEGGPSFSCQKMTLDRPDKSRYQNHINVYFAYPFRPEKGKKYTVIVSSPTRGTATSTITVPGKGSISPLNPSVFRSPYSSPIPLYGATATLAPEAKAFLIRIYIDYLSPRPDGSYVPTRFELPIRKDVISYFSETYKKIYPQPMLRTTSPSAPAPRQFPWLPEIRYEETVAYTTSALASILKDEIYEHEGCSVRFVQAVFYLTQFDEPLWNYYSVVNLYRDKFSMRTDEQNYTNINGGVGIFGSTSVDSLLWPLPEKIPPPPPIGSLGCQ